MSSLKFLEHLDHRDGVYFSKTNTSVSYPAEGNGNCFKVEEESFWFQHRNHCIVETVKRLHRQGLFFDVGGGNGYVSKGLEENNIATVLVEPGVAGAINARSRGLPRVICSTLKDAGIPNASIPAIGVFDVIEHVKDELSFLESIHTHLQPEGKIFITVPAYSFLWSKEDDFAGHFRRYTLPELKDLMARSGFQVEFATYFFSILPVPIFLFRVLPNLLRSRPDLASPKRGHKIGNKLIQRIADWFWSKELNRVKAGKTIPFGGSCLVVAKKRPY